MLSLIVGASPYEQLGALFSTGSFILLKRGMLIRYLSSLLVTTGKLFTFDVQWNSCLVHLDLSDYPIVLDSLFDDIYRMDEPLLAFILPRIFDSTDGSNRYTFRLLQWFVRDPGGALDVRICCR
jgi:hypothetical protein